MATAEDYVILQHQFDGPVKVHKRKLKPFVFKGAIVDYTSLKSVEGAPQHPGVKVRTDVFMTYNGPAVFLEEIAGYVTLDFLSKPKVVKP